MLDQRVRYEPLSTELRLLSGLGAACTGTCAASANELPVSYKSINSSRRRRGDNPSNTWMVLGRDRDGCFTDTSAKTVSRTPIARSNS